MGREIGTQLPRIRMSYHSMTIWVDHLPLDPSQALDDMHIHTSPPLPQACKQLSLVKRAKLRAAILQWARGRLLRAFSWWHEHASRKVTRDRKGRAYLALLLGRAAAFSLFILRANAERKRRSRGARALRRLATLRKSFRGWRLGVALVGQLEDDLLRVFSKVGMYYRNPTGEGGYAMFLLRHLSLPLYVRYIKIVS